MKLFPKKFRVKVSHFAEARYTVAWCHYRFIPIWDDLHFWFDQGHPGTTQCWSTNMWDYKEAEEIARKLKNIEDVKEYYKPLNAEAKEWHAEEKEYWKKNAPYKTKIIK